MYKIRTSLPVCTIKEKELFRTMYIRIILSFFSQIYMIILLCIQIRPLKDSKNRFF